MENLFNARIDYFVMKKCSPNWRLEYQTFPKYGLVMVLTGSARYLIDGVEYNVQAGDLICFSPGVTRYASPTGMSIAALDFTLLRGRFGLPVVSKFTRTEQLDRLLAEFQYEWLQKGKGCELKCDALFLLILHALLYGGSVSAANPHVEKIKRYIVDHSTEAVSVAKLAELTGLNTVYCGALFRKTQGVTIAEYANRIRVERAAALLTENHNISEAAYACGFNDVYYFSSTFKRIMGVPPSVYRDRSMRGMLEKTKELQNHLQD